MIETDDVMRCLAWFAIGAFVGGAAMAGLLRRRAARYRRELRAVFDGADDEGPLPELAAEPAVMGVWFVASPDDQAKRPDPILPDEYAGMSPEEARMN